MNEEVKESTERSDLNYPILNYKEVDLEKTFFYFILGIIPIFCLFFTLYLLMTINIKEELSTIMLFGLFGLIGLVFLIKLINDLRRYYLLKMHGKKVEATVYDYIENKYMVIDDKNAQIIKLLIDIGEGPKFILYESFDSKREYPIDSKINIIIYNDYIIIDK